MGICPSRRHERGSSSRISHQSFTQTGRKLILQRRRRLAAAEVSLPPQRTLRSAGVGTELALEDVPADLLAAPLLTEFTVLYIRQAEVPVFRRGKRSWIRIYKFLLLVAFAKRLLRVRKAWSAQGQVLNRLKGLTNHLIRKNGVLLYRSQDSVEDDNLA